jgi:hypothetical protein
MKNEIEQKLKKKTAWTFFFDIKDGLDLTGRTCTARGGVRRAVQADLVAGLIVGALMVALNRIHRKRIPIDGLKRDREMRESVFLLAR